MSAAFSTSRPSSVDVYRGFCALHDVMCYITDSSPFTSGNQDMHPNRVDIGAASDATYSDGRVLPSLLTSAGRHISGIVLPAFRLEIMEDVFSLLFARNEHLRDLQDSPDRQSCDSEPENFNEDVSSPKRQEFLFSVAGGNTDRGSTPGVSDAAMNAHEVPLGTLTVESRYSPLEVSSSSVDGHSDELSGSQTVSNGSVQCADESGFLARDYVLHNILLLLHDCCEKLLRELATKLRSADNRDSSPGEQHSAGLQLKQRVETLHEHVQDAQWRLRIVSVPRSVPISGLPKHREPKRHRRRSKHYRDGVDFKESAACLMTSHHSNMDHTIVSKMLCRPDSLMNLCLTEGRIAEAEEVVKVSYLANALRVLFVNIVLKYSLIIRYQKQFFVL